MGRMKQTLTLLILLADAAAAYAQGTPQPSSAPPSPAATVPNSAATQNPQGGQAPQRGFIAPLVDIRIQGDGITLPGQKSPEPEKPPAK